MDNGAKRKMIGYGVAAMLGAGAMGLAGGWASVQFGLAGEATGAAVRSYILEHPEILPEAMERLEAREAASRLAPMADAVRAPFPGAVLGNPRGSVVLVEFSDYACGYCRHSVAEVEALIATNPDLKVVIREYPILSEQSAAAARMALAAAEQGRFAAFHKAMFAAGRPSTTTIEAAARKAGLDLERARKFAASAAVARELQSNHALASQLGFNGTPSWVAGDQAFSGAVPGDVLARALARPADPAKGV